MEQQFKQRLDPNRYDAIHRAVLAGLLSNIGQKTDAHEYTGARGMKFNLFPGSALFKTKPPWVMAGEVVETTRLYARTVAAIRPEWIERIAEHLVKRTYSDPHWNPQTGHVVAYEKVTLYGLPVVPRRTVHYGPIDPKLSRELFIKHALVEVESNISAPFIRHNQRLVDDIQTLEAKTRQRGLLVAEQARFDFYDARIPPNIHNVPAFNRWHAQAEKDNPKFLFMSRRDLMLRSGADVTAELFPDTLSVNGLALTLSYHFEPGHPADGVTVAIPLAVLNQAPAERFEWLVPGLLREKITALIKSLPKPLRVQLIPAPEVAAAAEEKLDRGVGSLLDALAEFLGKRAGTTIRRGDFDQTALIEHLNMNFSVVDESGKVLAAGRDLDALRRQLGVQVRQRFNELPQSQWNRDGITRWDFDDLPESVEIVRHGMALRAYPAIVENPQTPSAVSLRLFDTSDAASAAMRGGLRKLFMLQLGDSVRQLQRGLSNIQRMALNYATLGSADELKADLITAAVDRALFDDAKPVRTREAFIELAESGWRRLSAATNELAEIVDEVLSLRQELAIILEGKFPTLLADAVRDMQQQLTAILPAHFVLTTPRQWLPHLPRFLRGIQVRVKKLTNAGLSRDRSAIEQVRPYWQRYLALADLHRRHHVADPELTEYRWMLEELRISLFAQELKTSIPISPQRVDKQLAKVRNDRAWQSR